MIHGTYDLLRLDYLARRVKEHTPQIHGNRLICISGSQHFPTPECHVGDPRWRLYRPFWNSRGVALYGTVNGWHTTNPLVPPARPRW